MGLVQESARKLRDHSLSVFAGWYAVTRFTPVILRLFR